MQTEAGNTTLPDIFCLAREALRENPGWLDEVVDEKEASGIVLEAVTTLRTKRCRGGGPPFIKLGTRVGYVRRDLFEYIAARRRTSTSEAA